MEQNRIIIQKENHIATLIINEPKTLNALNTELLNEMSSAVQQLAQDKDVRVVIITGTERAFVAGANIKEMSDLQVEEAKAFGLRGANVFRAIETMPQPVIAAINGFALGGGCELAMACDIRLASDKAKFGQPEVGLGITPGFSGTQRLARLVGFAKAKELIYTGKVISANDALQIGLVNQVVAHDELMQVAKEMAAVIATQAPLAVQYSKQAINQGWDLDIANAIALEAELFAKCFDTNDQKRGMEAFLNKQKTDFQGN